MMVVLVEEFEREYLVCDCIPMFQSPTLEVVLEFQPEVIWQYPVLCGTLRLKNRIVFFNKLVEEGPFGNGNMIASLRWRFLTG